MSKPLINKRKKVVRTIVVNETDDLIDVLLKNKIDVQNIRKELKIIAAKTRNNKIGYARFNTKSYDLKLIVCPKVFGFNQDKFLTYLKSYFQMLLKYPKSIGRFDVDNTLIELAHISNGLGNFGFDDLLDAKYENALNGIYSFFKKYKTFRPQYMDHVSSDLAYELNLQKTIEEIDKSQIHQRREILDYHSLFATIALSTLKQFRSNTKKSLKKETLSITQKSMRLLSSKFKLKSNSKDYKKLFHRKYIKLFQSLDERKLYTNLLILLGKEDFFDQGYSISSQTVSEKVTSVFFEANSLYEWHVYDYLIVKYGANNVQIKPSKSYSLIDKNSDCIKTLRAEPDFVVNFERKLYVIDAKWKMLNSFNSSFIYDYLKLQRDADLFGTFKCLLIYPSVSIDVNIDLPLQLDTALSRNFSLDIQEVPVI